MKARKDKVRVMETPAPEEPQALQVQQVLTDEYRENYANSVHVSVSIWDFKLVFGVTADQTETSNLQVDTFQGVRLSPQQTKAVHTLLGQRLAQYEAAFGVINAGDQAPPPQPQPGQPVAVPAPTGRAN